MTADSAGIQFIRYNRSARALSRFDYGICESSISWAYGLRK